MARTYGGWTVPRSEGLLGMTTSMTIALFPWILGLIIWPQINIFAAIAWFFLGVLAALSMFIKVDGRTLIEWMSLTMNFAKKRRKGLTSYLSGPFSPRAGGLYQLPGVLGQFKLYRGQDTSGLQKFALLHYEQADEYTVVFRVWPQGVGVADAAVVNAWVDQWGGVLSAWGDDSDIVAATAVVETFHSTGMKVRNEVARFTDEDAPRLAQEVMVEAAGPESGYRMLASRAVPESLNYPNDGVTPGDATSVGLFQIQTPMNMPVADAMDRTRHITWFYDTADQLADPSQQAWEIAANVERPREDLRYKYQEWEETADYLLAHEGDIAPASLDCAPGDSTSGSSGTPANATEFAKKAIAAAREQMGLPYVWAGGDHNGPTMGGFDCSGLTMFAYAQGSGGSVLLDHYTTNQMNSPLLAPRDTDDIQAGDLVFFNGASDPQHVGLAINATTMIHAPTTGDVVKEAPISDGGELVAVRAVKDIPQSNSAADADGADGAGN